MDYTSDQKPVVSRRLPPTRRVSGIRVSDAKNGDGFSNGKMLRITDDTTLTRQVQSDGHTINSIGGLKRVGLGSTTRKRSLTSETASASDDSCEGHLFAHGPNKQKKLSRSVDSFAPSPKSSSGSSSDSDAYANETHSLDIARLNEKLQTVAVSTEISPPKSMAAKTQARLVTPRHSAASLTAMQPFSRLQRAKIKETTPFIAQIADDDEDNRDREENEATPTWKVFQSLDENDSTLAPTSVKEKQVLATTEEVHHSKEQTVQSHRSPVATAHKPIHASRSIFWKAIGPIVLFTLLFVNPPTIFQPPQEVESATLRPDYNRSVYVPGAGFSGFWYTLGKLQSIFQDNHGDVEFYCFSAGCLGSASVLTNRTLEDVAEIAIDLQQRWRSGVLPRHHIVDRFVRALVYNLPGGESSFADVRLLDRLHIITSGAPEDKRKWGLQTYIRTPKNPEELVEMLVQTTWIPIATGDGLWYKDHMDGGFHARDHPACGLGSVTLPSRWDLILNILNPNLSREKLLLFWKLGMGIEEVV